MVTDGDGVPSPSWPCGCRAVARAQPPGDEGGEPVPLDPWVGSVGSVGSCVHLLSSLSCYIEQ